jgi:hypothetical protein
MRTLALLALLLPGTFAPAEDKPTIAVPENASSTVILAAKEVRRYVYLRTGLLPDILKTAAAVPLRPNVIVVAPAGSKLIGLLPLESSFRDTLNRMNKDGHCLKTISTATGRILLITGYDDTATLYGAYTYAEKLGVRFHAHGDVIPDGRIDFKIPDCSEWHIPLFATRGLQPFHDFPEGPDWWNLDDYKAIFGQMAKMKMNFFGLHTYPEGGAGPEPTVWIGFKEDIRPGNGVSSSYPARYYTTTGDPSWGFNPRKTGDYFYGCGQLFETDFYGSELMKGYTPHVRIGLGEPIPKQEFWNVEARTISPTEWNDLFARTAGFYSSAFSFGRDLGIAMCIGTETPLVLPTPVRSRVSELGKDTTESRLRQELYEGMFERIKQTIPIDYYWFWTPEDWTWSGNNELQVEKSRGDLEAAQRAAERVKAPFALATCGWVLGPKQDRSMFDTFLPKSWAISCISRDLGYEPVDAGFAKITGRPKWAIPWLEDDPALTIPQLWAGRMRRDAADALAYGCTGLIGIHWRTKVLSPNISALAKAAWDQHGWNPQAGEKLNAEQAIARSKQPERDLPTDDFYLDWAENQFGPGPGAQIAALYSRLDGMETYDKGRASAMNMPVPADWVSGPGGIKADTLTWEQRKKDYGFVDELERIRGSVTGPENLDRFDYWLNMLRYLRATGKFACSAGEINRLIEKVKKDSLGERSQYRQGFVDLRTRQMHELEEVIQCLLRTVSTNGELGTLANWQQHIMTFFVFIPGHEIDKLLNQPLPDSCWPSRKNLEQERIIVPTVRTAVRRGEDVRVKAILPAGSIKSARLFWRSLSAKKFMQAELTHINRAVWEGAIRAKDIADDLEYYLEVKTSKGTTRFPSGAPERNQTVVVY